MAAERKKKWELLLDVLTAAETMTVAERNVAEAKRALIDALIVGQREGLNVTLMAEDTSYSTDMIRAWMKERERIHV